MKKSIFLFGLLATALCLTACGSKDFNMTFEEALDIANHSALQDILAENDNFEQNFAIAGIYNADGTKIDANISSTSKQSLANKNSESSTTFGANITAEGETVKVNGALDVKFINDSIYLNLSSLDLTGSEELSMVAMMTEGFKNQWFVVPMSGLSEMPDTFSILKDSKDLNSKTKEIVLNGGSTVYNGKFTQFNGYNAWKFSLDNEKLNALIKEYYADVNSSLDDEYAQEIPELNIQNFEGYLVITGKDKVTTVIENMQIQDNDTTMDATGFSGEDFEMSLGIGEEEEIVSITANKKGGKYEISAKIADSILLDGTISAKLAKSSIDLNFDATLTVKSEIEGEKDTVIPFNGSWKYKSISEFTTTAPESAQDLTEMIEGYLGGMFGGDDYDYEDYDYEDYDEDYNDEDYDYSYEDLEGIEDINTEDINTEDIENIAEVETEEIPAE